MNRTLKLNGILSHFKRNNRISRHLSSKSVILGIETSCDDTGCAIIDTEGNILGEALNSQHLTHLSNGGIIPPIARDLHRKNIENVVQNALDSAKITFDNIDAVAVTTKPGLPMSLLIGTRYGKYLCKKYKKPFMPIHHMEAHALTSRLFDKTIEYPFLVLLISGGHSLIAVVENVDKFYLLGECIDDSPGESIDKIARRMKLRNIPEFSTLSGGQAIELAASKAENPSEFELTIPLLQYKHCNFSFSGLRNQVDRILLKHEKEYNIPVDGVIPGVYNLCAGLQIGVTRHICHRIQRAMVYVENNKLIPENKKVLVVSGGVACNNFIAKGLKIVCNEMGYKFVRPPSKFCTDNGVMIAWNGVERWKQNIGIYENFDEIDIEGTSPLGIKLIDDVINQNISCKWVKLKQLLVPQKEWTEEFKNL